MELIKLTENAGIVWARLQRINPGLVAFDCPAIVLSTRMTKTSGLCYWWKRRVNLSKLFLDKHPRYMLSTVLPHELIHQADTDLHGAIENNDHHRATWCKMMIKYGLTPNPYSDI